MKKQIKHILTDLYALDPTLKEREAELVELLNRLLVSRPDTRIDEHFVRQLRQQLLASGSHASADGWFTHYSTIMTELFTVRRLAYAGAGVTAVIAVALVMYTGYYNTPLEQPPTRLRQGGITEVAPHAFGSLKNDGSQGERAQYPTGLGAGGGGSMAMVEETGATDSAKAPAGGGGGDAAARMIVPPSPRNYRFVYEGDLDLAETELPVLRRVKSPEAAKSLAAKFTDVDLNSVDLTAFSDLAVQNISLVEDHELGYAININLEEGVLSISEHWRQWQEKDDCRTEECWQARRLKESDIPIHETLIAMANAFIARYGVDMSNYGEPQVDMQWRANWEARPETDRWIPEVMDVIYPLQIDGQTVYEENGNVFGAHVNINVRRNKVSGLWNYTTQNYERSQYPAETDEARIKKIVAQGGRFMPWWPEAEEQEEIAVGDPERILVKIWRYNEGQSDEFIVPALRFPIIDKPEDSYVWQNAVVVPLISEMLDEYERDGGGPIIMPTEPEPLIKAAPAEGAPTSSEPALSADEATIQIER